MISLAVAMPENLLAITGPAEQNWLFITNEELAVMKSHKTTHSSGQS
jgi:hypothetical protein